ncbi:hypothetical protein EDB89DRAFT_2012595 [Lactarius sanguifluus]|nr:hypothetical protein EDB89DRAFT_2012595 [Lactarius sanguifluus]
MPLTTQSSSHGEMTIPMTDSNPPLIRRVEDRVRRGQAGSSVATITSGCTPVPPTLDGCADERSPVSPLELEPSAPPFSSGSTVSRFMDRLGVNAPSLSSLRTIPSWRSGPIPDANKIYAKFRIQYSSEESDTPSQPHSRGARPHHPSVGSLQHRYLRRQNKRLMNQNGGHGPLHTFVPPSNLRERISHSTMRRHADPSSSSLSTRPSSSLDSHVPVPSTSEESYPSPYSADALAVFHPPVDKRGLSFFKGRRRHEDILEDRVQVIFEEATDATSTTAGVSSAHSLAKRRGRIGRLRRRIRALAESMSPPRSKTSTKFNNERRSPHLNDYDSEEHDIPCLAYISCIW